MASIAWDLVIRGATVFDGTGGSPFAADLAIQRDRIGALGRDWRACARDAHARRNLRQPYAQRGGQPTRFGPRN
jgi:N-acyl-D-aspartate/D-glutamate deacylase